MIEITTRHDMCFIIMRGVHNKPGIGRTIVEGLKKEGIAIESFQAVSTPGSAQGEILMLAVNSAHSKTAVEGIKKANGKIGRNPLLITNLIGIVVRGVTLKDSTDALHLAFSVCERLGINVVMAYTTLVSLNLYVEEKQFDEKLVDELQKEFQYFG